MNDIENKSIEICDLILKISKKEKVGIIKIPNWEPVNLTDGLTWIRSTIYEGYYVKWRIVNSMRNKYIELLKWEYGEEEPDFT
jgi:hypothetical protein